MTPPRDAAPTAGPPLAAKLGIKAAMAVTLLGGPRQADELLGTLPPKVTLARSLRGRSVDLIVCFSTQRHDLERRLGSLLDALGPDGVLWVAWPKRASGVPTDLSDEVVRSCVLPTGWVDTKVCAIDATWSGLKFVLRKELRAPSAASRSPARLQREPRGTS